MLPDILAKKAIKTEVIKLSLLSFLIVSGGIIFGIFVPLREYLSWMDFTFYSTIGFLVIIYQTFSFYFKARKIKQLMSIDFDADIFENVPVTTSDKSTRQGPKGSLKVDELAASFCPRCGSSFTKTYQFCPNCSYCGIIKKLK